MFDWVENSSLGSLGSNMVWGYERLLNRWTTSADHNSRPIYPFLSAAGQLFYHSILRYQF